MTVRIVGATLRDISYVAANMRPEDRAEVSAQFNSWSPEELAAVSLREHAYCALVDNNPEASFGAGTVGHSGLWCAWSWMTRKGWRAVPRMTAFVREVMFPAILEAQGQRVEARALATNTSARQWLKKLGATERCELPCYGRNGEAFILYDWVRSDWDAILSQKAKDAQPADQPSHGSASRTEAGNRLGAQPERQRDVRSPLDDAREHSLP